MLVRIIDDNGFFLRDDFTEEITKNTISTPCPSGLYLPRWDGTKWVEGKTAGELSVIQAAQQVVVQQDTNRKTITDQLKTALTNNKTYLAIVSPTASDKESQIKALTRQMNKLLRLTLNQLDGTD